MRNPLAQVYCRKCYREGEKAGDEERQEGGARKDSKNREKRDNGGGYNKSGHEAFKKKEKVSEIIALHKYVSMQDN